MAPLKLFCSLLLLLLAFLRQSFSTQRRHVARWHWYQYLESRIIDAYIYIYRHMCICQYLQICMYIHLCRYLHICIYTYDYICIYAYVFTCVHTYVYISDIRCIYTCICEKTWAKDELTISPPAVFVSTIWRIGVHVTWGVQERGVHMFGLSHNETITFPDVPHGRKAVNFLSQRVQGP